MSDLKIEVSGETASVYSPYNAEFVQKMRRIGGAKWNRGQACWDVPAHAVSAVRLIMKETYGESDTEPAEKVTARVTFTDEMSENRSAVTLFGKTVASAFGRDSGAKVGEDVTFIVKNPRSGGSRNHWETIIPEGAVAEIHNVPRNMVVEGRGYIVEIVEDNGPDEKSLREEKAALLKRLSEINAVLGET